ncbi:hypothetical protein BGZ60DRAFT_139671 [Tricladium varicosporioides]|nr:hypothetical protein BGZ60DRAFT_139671 [Hymenoscyphus varicosporioides]
MPMASQCMVPCCIHSLNVLSPLLRTLPLPSSPRSARLHLRLFKGLISIVVVRCAGLLRRGRAIVLSWWRRVVCAWLCITSWWTTIISAHGVILLRDLTLIWAWPSNNRSRCSDRPISISRSWSRSSCLRGLGLATLQKEENETNDDNDNYNGDHNTDDGTDGELLLGFLNGLGRSCDNGERSIALKHLDEGIHFKGAGVWIAEMALWRLMLVKKRRKECVVVSQLREYAID